MLFAYFDAHGAKPSATSLVENIILSTQKINSHESWHQNQIIMNNYRNQLMSKVVSEPERCQALNQLSEEHLINFYDDIYGEANTSLSTCKSTFRHRLNLYFSIKSATLNLNYKKISEQKIKRCSERHAKTFGPEIDYLIDAKNGGVLYGDTIPKCGIVFTFDDGPHPTLTRQLLHSLSQENLLVNFFVVGRRVNASPDILKEQHSSGHLIGNHSMTHAELRKLPFKEATVEIEDGFTAITKVIGEYLPFFRFPYGARNKALQAYLDHFSRVEFFWNIDTLDWKIKDPVKLLEYTLGQIEKTKGGILLMHDVQPQTISVMPYLLTSLREAGYTPYIIRPEKTEKLQNVH